ncbi:HD domain-containing protein [Patescibacteria group bacterium]|nr:HD domain-containing protein [Patescibacteria group bacterium]MBU1885632.1 HD domain-containing protein [Patescibacteria group bacterium]
MSLSRDIDFLFEIGTLRYVQRQWRQFLNPDFENLSEHILRVTWIALVIAKHEGAQDTGKIVKMALVHDLSESRSVDVHYLSRQYTDRHEKKAIADTLSNTAVEKEFLQLWHEYEKRDSLEAKIVKDADNIDVDLELKEQKVRGFQLPDDWQKMRNFVADKKLYTKTAKKMYAAIQKTNPNNWHIKGNNRFLAGDWQK